MRMFVAIVTVVLLFVVGGVVTGVSNLKEAISPSKFVQPSEEIIEEETHHVLSTCVSTYLNDHDDLLVMYQSGDTADLDTALATVISGMYYSDWIPDEERPEERQYHNLYCSDGMIAEIRYNSNTTDINSGDVWTTYHYEPFYSAMDAALGIE